MKKETAKPKKATKSSKKKKNVIETVLLCFMDEEDIFKDGDLYITPYCSVSQEEDSLDISFDQTFCNPSLSASIVLEFVDNNIIPEVTETYWSILDKKGTIVGTLFAGTIKETMDQFDLSMEKSIEMLSNQAIEAYETFTKNKSLH